MHTAADYASADVAAMTNAAVAAANAANGQATVNEEESGKNLNFRS